MSARLEPRIQVTEKVIIYVWFPLDNIYIYIFFFNDITCSPGLPYDEFSHSATFRL